MKSNIERIGGMLAKYLLLLVLAMVFPAIVAVSLMPSIPYRGLTTFATMQGSIIIISLATSGVAALLLMILLVCVAIKLREYSNNFSADSGPASPSEDN